MKLIMLLIFPFLTGFVIRNKEKSETLAWFLSSLVIPAIILFDEFVLPYRGGGISFWTIALAIGGFYGVLSGGLGVLVSARPEKPGWRVSPFVRKRIH